MNKQRFYRLTLAELKALYQAGGLTSAAYLKLILETQLRAGWKMSIENVDQFCAEWGLSKSSFYRARRKLQAEGFLSVQHTRLTLTCNTNSHEWESSATDETQSVTDETQSAIDETPTSLKPRAGAGSGDLLDSYYIPNIFLKERDEFVSTNFVSTNRADPSYERFLGYRRKNPWLKLHGQIIEAELVRDPDPKIRFAWLKTHPTTLSPWWSVEFVEGPEMPPSDPSSPESEPHLGNPEQSPAGIGGVYDEASGVVN